MTFFLLLFGFLFLLAPKAMWFLEIGWKFADSEPSEAYLVFHRLIGVILVAIGFLKFFFRG
ncbi:DUF6199 family natural product biosynthesis protein [Fusibacter sp. JL298sf-3]